MKGNNHIVFQTACLLCASSTFSPQVLGAESTVDAGRACDAHAAAMVAEMQAASTAPLSDHERALVRRIARKSCLTQSGDASAEVVEAAATAGTAEPEPQAVAKQAPAPDRGFLGAFEPLLKGGTQRNEGHKRLRRRGRY